MTRNALNVYSVRFNGSVSVLELNHSEKKGLVKRCFENVWFVSFELNCEHFNSPKQGYVLLV